MKILLTIIITTIIATSCALWEKQEIDIIYAPRLLSKAMTDNELAGIRDVTFFTFNNSGTLVGDTILSAEQLRNEKEDIIIVKGLLDGEYMTVGFANLERSVTWQYERGKSTADQLFVQIIENVPMDSLHYNKGVYTLARGLNVYATGEFFPQYYDMTLKVRGLSELTIPLVDPTFEIQGVPTRLDVDGAWTPEYYLSYLPQLEVQDADVLSSKCTVPRFTDQSNARLVINSAKGLVQNLSLRPSKFLNDPKDIRLNIDITFAATTVTITVNDWFAGSYTIIEYGE